VKLGFRDLNNVNIFKNLDNYYDVNWVFQNSVPESFNLKNKSFFLYKATIFREYIWSLLFELKNYKYNKFIIGAKQSFPFLGMSKKKIIFLKIIYKIKFVNFFEILFELILNITYKSREVLFNNSSRVVLCFASSKDLVFDDIVRDANKYNKKVILICLNWDNATSKPFIKKPDFIFTWGKQTADLAEKIHKIKSIPIGCPRYENYKRPLKFDIENTSINLGLKKQINYILFAGVGFPFPEIETLNSLSFILEKNKFYNYKIIYRQHPYAWKKNEIQKSEFYNKYVVSDPTIDGFHENDLSQYRFLFKICKALITPYSTMLVESLMNGIPLLLVAFDYEDSNKFDWTNAANVAPHLAILKETNFILKCSDFNKLEHSVLELLKYNNTSTTFKELSDEIVLNNNLSYFENLNLQINNIIKC
jgi:hypothetical protein